jgi:16S rRNA (cytidine1402-2'-O)-methyltransferase
MPGTLFVVATPIGNLEDITVRALRVLREVALIAAEDTRRTAHLLARHAISTPTTSLHEHNESKKTSTLIAQLRKGDDVALVSDAGTPTISDPGSHFIRQAIDAGIQVVPVPGPSAAMAALAVSGFPTDTFTFLGFPPTRSKPRIEWFERLRAIGGTVVFFEAPHRVHDTLRTLQQTVGDCVVSVGRELTKAHEQLVNGPISNVQNLLGKGLGEFTIVARIEHLADQEAIVTPTGQQLATELGDMTANKAVSRRRAIADLARRHRLAPNDVYAAIEAAKKSG